MDCVFSQSLEAWMPFEAKTKTTTTTKRMLKRSLVCEEMLLELTLTKLPGGIGRGGGGSGQNVLGARKRRFCAPCILIPVQTQER
eukprot:752278-Hanusia_phi.AAC.5